MSRKATSVVLIAVIIIGVLTGPVGAQSGEPPTEQIVHVVRRGETLFSIAQQYGTTVDAITHANGISDPRQIYVGQRLIIPGGARAAHPQTTVTHVVRPGDTLSSLAVRYRTTWQALVQINRMLSPSTIYVGQIIQVPGSDPLDSSGQATGSPVSTGVPYVMQAGDTLLRIALRHDISQWTLAAQSRITSPALVYPGQKLLIPGESPSLLPEPFLDVQVQPLPVTQGATMVIAVRTLAPVELRGRLFEQDVRFADENGTYYALLGVHVFTEPGVYELALTAQHGGGQSTVLTTEVVVEPGRFGYERIDLPPDRTNLLDPGLIAAERERLEALRRTFTPERRWTMPFQRPSTGAISAHFGTHRAYDTGPYTSYHTGVDFSVPRHTPVYASAAGVVVLAEPLVVRGNTVFVDHGWGVLTGYWHLSSIDVQAGQEVAPGDMVGKVGNTGLSTGAHLHWEVLVGGTSVNGLQWLEEFYLWPSSEQTAASE